MDATQLAIHSVFEALAWLSAALATYGLTHIAHIEFPIAAHQRGAYYGVFVASAALGAYAFGTLNLIVCGMPGIGRSIEGAIFGAVVGIELYKVVADVRVRTGARFAAPLAIGVAVGRIGCYFSGLDDFTYGTPANWPWCHDFATAFCVIPRRSTRAPRWRCSWRSI